MLKSNRCLSFPGDPILARPRVGGLAATPSPGFSGIARRPLRHIFLI
jgi:hypothetical protein